MPTETAPWKTIAALCVLTYGLTGCGWLVRQGTIAYIGVNSNFVPKHVEISIHTSFLEEYKDRVLIYTEFTVDKAMAAPLPTELDGDLHIAGRAPQVGLPIVAEIVNARFQKPAIDVVHDAQSTGQPLRISGVWRIWPEHAGHAEEEQGEPLKAFGTDNPDHVFEIHPVTRVGGIGLLDSFVPVKGFVPGDARRTFGIYEKATCTIRVEPKSVSIVTGTGLYNDVEFIMQLTDDAQQVVADGRFVTAAAMDLKGEVLVPRLRMVFVNGTPPEAAVRALKRGDRLHVFGEPRLDLREVARRVHDSLRDSTVLTKPLPYEITILGVYAPTPG